MFLFERYEDKKFEVLTLEDCMKIYDFSTEELEDELNYINAKIEKTTNGSDLEVLQKISAVISMALESQNMPSHEDIRHMQDKLLLPEYQEGGYFTSDEFIRVEKEVDAYITSLPEVTKYNFDTVKQQVLKEQYHIDWLPLEKRYKSNVQVFVSR